MRYSKIADLDSHFCGEQWTWRRSPTGREHWIGVDKLGREWLVKMTGSFNALRERVFDQVVQTIGLSCQSCVFLTLPKNCEQLYNSPHAELHQGAIAYIQTPPIAQSKPLL